jgi:hypothetical protein
MLQIQGAKGEAVLIYREPLATKEMWCHRLSCKVNKMTNFQFFSDAHSINSKIAIKFDEAFGIIVYRTPRHLIYATIG